MEFTAIPEGNVETPNTGGAYLTGKLLLAMPGMGDPRFHRAEDINLNFIR